MPKTKKQKLASALRTANLWSSDQKGRGLSLLSLGSTRKVHTEDHRAELLKEIDDNCEWCRANPASPGFPHYDPVKEVEKLTALRELVVVAAIGEEWLTYEIYNGIIDGWYLEEKNADSDPKG